ncbi:MarR family transcriptional regulator [Paraburkholderia caledonica]|jgi:DNA-binding MarR family transcriptional regulator|uniref:DNA-binding MarR family transcriptional regulator n=2 Tax=Paraburkholderia TaxID=1822464 RepID=A0ABU1L412_9BURK|nr:MULTISPECIES: winged helix DNA-binding protein [Paraburkholderia]OWJ58102.1 MarR family transcriptional regulator [Burkholderia sp. Bk]MBT2789640.1 MarR family transcriptional regulator [Paraburkholderia strydomiana]MDR6377956.1 DNA-binding MarR family transcriptional regulator [Paraburkholderia caledonica]TCF99729.1 MarR family transcriptional regulator [Paraburkholderia strydomiana]CAH2903685.1 MAG: Transcriptional regulator, MarR family [uncultured Paraburkholderia sp.]
MNRPLSYDECNCFALRQAARHITQLYERHLSTVGVTAAQFTILAKLARTPNLPILDLADAMVMERTTLVRAMKPLQRDGLVVAESAEHDGRTYLFSLTEKGEKTFDQAAIAWRAAQSEFEEKFGRDRAKALRAELFTITG